MRLSYRRGRGAPLDGDRDPVDEAARRGQRGAPGDGLQGGHEAACGAVLAEGSVVLFAALADGDAVAPGDLP